VFRTTSGLASLWLHLCSSNCLRRLSWASDVRFSFSTGTLKFIAISADADGWYRTNPFDHPKITLVRAHLGDVFQQHRRFDLQGVRNFHDSGQRSKLASTFQDADIVAVQARHLRKFFLRDITFHSQFAQAFSKQTPWVCVSHVLNDSGFTPVPSTHNRLPHYTGHRWYNRTMREYALFLHLLANRVLNARLSTGARMLDASDFKAWLLELSDRAEAADTLEEFFANV